MILETEGDLIGITDDLTFFTQTIKESKKTEKDLCRYFVRLYKISKKWKFLQIATANWMPSNYIVIKVRINS